MQVIPFPPQRGEILRLGDMLAAARDELAAQEAPPWVEAQLRAELARRRDGLRRLRPVATAEPVLAGSGAAPGLTRSGPDGLAWLLALGAMVALLFAFGVAVPHRPAADAALAERSGFESVVAPQRWSQWGGARGADHAWLVEAELPAQQLASLGLPFDPARAAEPVRAELLLHASGEILAVRLPR